MKSNFKQLIGGVAVACAFSMLLTGCLVEIKPGKGKIQCEQIEDCAGNEICGADGFCQTVTITPTTCESIVDCSSGQICNGQDLCETVDLCFSDNECGHNERCNTEDHCLSAPGEEALAVCYGYCEKNDSPTTCFDDSECGQDEYCDFQDVEAGMAPGSEFSGAPQMIPPGQCRPTPAQECTAHSDCLDGQYCGWGYPLGQETEVPEAGDQASGAMNVASGLCTDLGFDGCVKESDCGVNATCVIDNAWGPGEQGTCVSTVQPCWSNEECGEGAYCAPEDTPHVDSAEPDGAPMMEAPMGVCVELLPGECFSDSDCGKNAVCEHPNPDMGPGTCAAVIIHCATDADCGWNEECSYGEFSAPENEDDAAMPAPMGICIPKEPTACTSDWECADDEYCEFDEGVWSSFGCQEHSEAMMPPQTGVCLPEGPVIE